MNKPEACCDNLIEMTAVGLNKDVIALMLVAVLKDNLGLSVNITLKWSVHQFKDTVGVDLIRLCRVYSSGGFKKLDTSTIVWECLILFPYLWASIHLVFIVAHAPDGQCCPIHKQCMLASCLTDKLTNSMGWVIDSLDHE